MGENEELVRLHITPLDQELLKTVIPASILPLARNISYHTLETFPEKRYGFVDLPEAEAEKVKRRLNGSTLKGAKMKIEKARPETRVEPTGEEEVPTKKRKAVKEGTEGSKKRKREVDVLNGLALKDRTVKRGWTEAPTTNKKRSKQDKESKEKYKEKRKRLKSKYTDGEECLLKTKLPPNSIGNLSAEELERKKRSRKKGSSRQVTIHEFEKTTKFPSFLKHSSATDRKAATEFVEGKGWVDEEGHLVEEVKETVRERPKKMAKPKKVVEEEEDDSTSSSGTSSDDTSSDEESDDDTTPTPSRTKAEKSEESASNSSSDDSEISDEEKGEESSEPPEHATPSSNTKEYVSKQTPSSGSKPLAIIIPPPETPSATKVHPLEALYKRPNPEDATSILAPKEAPFSFFGTGSDDDDEEVEEEGDDEAPQPLPTNPVPMTPFTRHEFETRTIRSAAPTPDTAHPTRMQRFWADSPEKDENADLEDTMPLDDIEAGEGEDEEEDEDPAPGQQGAATTDFQKWFWDNRRDLNRSWMSRRKSVAKEKRHRDNKARASKAV